MVKVTDGFILEGHGFSKIRMGLEEKRSIFFCPFSAFSEPLYPYLSLGYTLDGSVIKF